jgi:hypothetical protein
MNDPIWTDVPEEPRAVLLSAVKKLGPEQRTP